MYSIFVWYFLIESLRVLGDADLCVQTRQSNADRAEGGEGRKKKENGRHWLRSAERGALVMRKRLVTR